MSDALLHVMLTVEQSARLSASHLYTRNWSSDGMPVAGGRTFISTSEPGHTQWAHRSQLSSAVQME